MKKIIYFSIALFFYSNLILSQAPFWTETFGTGCNQGQYAAGFSGTNGTWTVTNTGFNGLYPNNWFISATEANTGIGNCSDGCISNFTLDNRTLHVAFDLNNLSPGFYDFGAAYLGGSGYETDIRAQSPVINCSSQNSIVLGFSYILEGVAGSDYFEVQYSPNGGTNWSVLSTPPPTNNASCSGQGLWTTYTIALPASANNNPNVKIGFRWQNTDPNGSDPSAALDDITLKSMAPASFSPSFTLASSSCVGSSLNLVANTGTFATSGYTWTSVPASTISAPNASATSITFGSAGIYTVSLTATSGATTTTTSNTIMINPNPNITVFSSNASCNGLCNGSATVSAGAGTFTYNFSGGGSNTTGIMNGFCAGAYTVVAVSAAGCSATSNFIIAQPAVLTISTSFTNGSCGACNGNITYTAGGGSLPYSFSVTPGGSANNLCAGTYTVLANDANACTTFTTVNISSASLSSSASSSSATCGTCANGSATVTPIGGTAPLTFSWAPTGGTAAVANSLIPGCYTVTVTDNSNCISTSTTCVGFATSISGADKETEFYFFPNPTKGTVHFNFGDTEKRDIRITDISGRILFETSCENETLEVDLGNYSNGIYLLRVNNSAFKIIKE